MFVLNNKIIACGKHGNNNEIKTNPLISITRVLALKNTRNDDDFVIAATNGKIIITKEKEYYDIKKFFNENKKVLLLTHKEELLILEEAINYNCHVAVFEKMFPIFEKIRYVSNPRKNLVYLYLLIDRISQQKLAIKKLSYQLSEKFQRKIARKIKYKSSLDNYFYFALTVSYQEVFKLKEERKNRDIIAFDFNSMYLDAMKGSFPDPKNLQRKTINEFLCNIKELNCGIYNVKLIGLKNTVFGKINPFKVNTLNGKRNFNITAEESIETLLFENEIFFYKSFFDDIFIIDGVYSENKINHPLINDGLKEYDTRLHYKSLGDTFLSNLSKYKILMMHSSSNIRYYKTSSFDSLENAVRFLQDLFILDIPQKSPTEKMRLIEKNYRNIITYLGFQNKKHKIKYLDINNNHNIYSLTSRVIANARLKMIKTIFNFLSHPTVELCYCNIDSIHISVDKNYTQSFLSKNTYLISKKIGALKIEAVASHGYWFDIGRYWLMDINDTVIKFSNTIFNSKFHDKKFVKARKIYKLEKNFNIYYVSSIYISIGNAFSYAKPITMEKIKDEELIDNIDFYRYDYDAVTKIHFEDIILSLRVKRSLFERISAI